MYRIGILQLTEYLDDCFYGFKAGLNAQHIKADFMYLSADGCVDDLRPLAQQLAASEVDLIFACSTPAALEAARLTADIPVIFTPVIDPIGSGLVRTMDRPGGKVTGVSGAVDPLRRILFIKQLLPCAKNIALLYHKADPASIAETNKFVAAAHNKFNLFHIPIVTASELSLLYQQLAPELDVLFLPFSKMIEDNYATIGYYADIIGLPVIASSQSVVHFGALGALVADHFQLGYLCAEKAVHILQGIPAGNIPVGIIKHPKAVLNSRTACRLGIKIPDGLVAEEEITQLGGAVYAINP